MWTDDYLRLRFAKGGRERPAVDCWGLYRLIVGERKGVWLSEFSGVEEGLKAAHALSDERDGGDWHPIPGGMEQEADLVLMTGIIGEGRHTVCVPFHVGYVTSLGRMLHVQDGSGVFHHAFRDTPRSTIFPTLRGRVLGIYRPGVLA